MKVTFKRRKYDSIDISLQNLTQSQAMALCSSITRWRSNSSEEIREKLRKTIQQNGKTDEDQVLMEMCDSLVS